MRGRSPAPDPPMRQSTLHRPWPLLLLGLALCSTACRKNRHYDDDHGGGSNFVYEQEPNDHADHPDFFGYVGPGDQLAIRGHVQAFGNDLFDGFGFVSAQPLEVLFTLRADDPFADLDLLVYDPYFDEFVAVFDSPYNPERGSFLVLDPDVEFHMVVDAYDQASSYTLELTVLHPTAGLSAGGALEPGAEPASRIDASGAARWDAPRAKAPATGYGRESAPPQRAASGGPSEQARVEAVVFERRPDGSWVEHRMEGVQRSSG